MKYVVIEICGDQRFYYGTFYTVKAAEVFISRLPPQEHYTYDISEIYTSQFDSRPNVH